MIAYRFYEYKNKEEYKSDAIEMVISTAVHFHKGQKDKNGEAYILHPLRIMMQMETFEEKVVAILHDVLEDTDCTIEYISERQFLSEEILDALMAITRMSNEKYFEYINRVKENTIARKVKVADLVDNLSRNGASVSLRKRYYKALNILCEKNNLPHDRRVIARFYGFEVYIDKLWPQIKHLEVNYQDESVFDFSLEIEKYPDINDYQYTEKVFMEWYYKFKPQIIKMIKEDNYYELSDW